MNVHQALACAQEALGEKARCHKLENGVCIVSLDGVELARALSWEPALRAAIKPRLDAAMKARAEEMERQGQELEDFMLFLREKLAPDFEEWRTKRKVTNDVTAVAPSLVVSAVDHENKTITFSGPTITFDGPDALDKLNNL